MKLIETAIVNILLLKLKGHKSINCVGNKSMSSNININIGKTRDMSKNCYSVCYIKKVFKCDIRNV